MFLHYKGTPLQRLPHVACRTAKPGHLGFHVPWPVYRPLQKRGVNVDSQLCRTLRDATSRTRPRAHLFSAFFTPLGKGTCARLPQSFPLSQRIALANQQPPCDAHRENRTRVRCHSRAIPFQSRQCSTLDPLLVSHEISGNLDMRPTDLADAAPFLLLLLFSFFLSFSPIRY